MKIELHHAPGTAAMAPHILLTEIGRPFERVTIDTTEQTPSPLQASAAIASATFSTLPGFSPATHMRPERTRYTASRSRSVSTCSALKPV